MPASKRDARELKKRVQQMVAKQRLREEQRRRRKRDNLLAAGALAVVLLLAVVLQLAVFSHNPTEAEAKAVEAGLGSPSASASPTPAQSNGPNIPAASTAAGKTFTGQLVLNGSPLGVELDGKKAPQAAAVFASLTAKNFFKGLTCHRLTDAPSFGVLQCGSKDGKGGSDPGYEWGPVENSPADGKYPAGTIAVARGSSTYSNGTQFFIVWKDTVLPQDTGGYTVMGKVTSGLDVVKKIAAGGITPGTSGATDGAPKTPVTIDSFSVK